MKRPRQIRGQATIEMVIGLIGFVVVFAGVFQMGLTGTESVENLVEARSLADENAAAGNLIGLETRYVSDWRDGSDGIRHTADDVPLSLAFDNLDDYDDPLQAPIPLVSLRDDPLISMPDQVARATASDALAVAADMYRGTTRREVDIEPVLQYLLFRSQRNLRLQDEVVMTGLSLQP